MTVGCLGALPPHSVLKAVCEAVPGEAFEWVEIAPDAFPRARSLRGLLVSDPYRRAIMPRRSPSVSSPLSRYFSMAASLHMARRSS